MIYLLFIIAGLMYALSASLPFWTSVTIQIGLTLFTSVSAALCWVAISRSVKAVDIPVTGLYYDAMLMIIYLIVPFLFVKPELTLSQYWGIMLTIIGLLMLKG